jgi:hypothetical protein
VDMNGIKHIPYMVVGLDSEIGTVTRYRLEGPGIESWWD